MKKLFLTIAMSFAMLSAMAIEQSCHFYGSSIDLSRENNPCVGRTDGGVEVIVKTEFLPLMNNPQKTVKIVTTSMPDGTILKKATKVVDKPFTDVVGVAKTTRKLWSSLF